MWSLGSCPFYHDYRSEAHCVCAPCTARRMVRESPGRMLGERSAATRRQLSERTAKAKHEHSTRRAKARRILSGDSTRRYALLYHPI